MEQFSKYVGLDVHKATIAVSIADAGRTKARFYGTIDNTPAAVAKLIKKLSEDGEALSVCYEAGPCGYGLYRQINATGQVCEVIAPSLIPKRASDRRNTRSNP